jgi:drug/metabolite transporter (DMT)-like permease
MSNLKSFWALNVTVFVWASSFAVIKVGLQEINPYFLSFIRALIAAAFLVTVIIASGELGKFIRYMIKNWRVLCFLGLIGIAVFDVLQNVGIKQTSSALAGVLLNTNPLFITALSVIFLGEIVTKNKIVGLGLGFIGMSLVIFGGQDIRNIVETQKFTGNALVILSAGAWAVYSTIGKRSLIDGSPLHLTAGSYVFGTLFSLPLIYLFDVKQQFNIGPVSWGVILYLGAIASGATFFLWGYALSKLEASRASVYLFMIPVVAVFVGWIFLGEEISPSTIIGGVLVLAGVYLSEKHQMEKHVTGDDEKAYTVKL